MNGGNFSAENYTLNIQKDNNRKEKLVKYTMFLFKQLGFEEWKTINIENL